MQAGERSVGVAGPGRGEGACEIIFFRDQVGGPIAHTAWLDEDDLRIVGEHVGEQEIFVDEPGQPALHSIERGTFGEPLPLFTAPWLGFDEFRGALADVVGDDEFSRWEDDDLVQVVCRTLIVDTELRQPVDFVSPEVDSDRGVSGRRIDVDDCPALRELAAVLDQPFAPVPELDKPSRQLFGVDFRPWPDNYRIDGCGTRAELLKERSDAGNDDCGASIWVAQPPEHFEALAHCFDAGADAFEGQGFPSWELHDFALGEELAEVVNELAGHRAGGATDHERAT